MRLSRLAIAVIGLAVSSMAAQAACDYPSRVEVPDGATATKDQMISGQKAVKQYMADMESYLACLEEQNAAAAVEGEDAEVTAQRSDLHVKRHNAAVEEMELLAARFNEQVRSYKARAE